MDANSLRGVMLEELKDLYSAESQITKALPKLVKKVSSEPLRNALNEHIEVTQEQIRRLDEIGKMLGEDLSGKTCQGMKGLLTEGEEILKEKDLDPALLDARIIGACQKVEHYEISGYGTVRTMAEQLGLEEIADRLQQTLEEEETTDENLSVLSEEEILPFASDEDELMEDEELEASQEEEAEEEEEPRQQKGKGKRKSDTARP